MLDVRQFGAGPVSREDDNTTLSLALVDQRLTTSEQAIKDADVGAAIERTLGLLCRVKADKRFTDEELDHYEAARRQRESADTYAYMAELWQSRGSAEKARLMLDKAIQLSPKHALATRLRTLWAVTSSPNGSEAAQPQANAPLPGPPSGLATDRQTHDGAAEPGLSG